MSSYLMPVPAPFLSAYPPVATTGNSAAAMTPSPLQASLSLTDDPGQARRQTAGDPHRFGDYSATVKAAWVAIAGLMTGTLVFLLYSLPRRRPVSTKASLPSDKTGGLEGRNPVWTYFSGRLNPGSMSPASPITPIIGLSRLNRLA